MLKQTVVTDEHGNTYLDSPLTGHVIMRAESNESLMRATVDFATLECWDCGATYNGLKGWYQSITNKRVYCGCNPR